MSVTLSDRCYRSLSFSGCGFLCIYHAGVCAAIKEYAPEMLSGSMSGASAGSIIAACLICNVCISRGASIILRIVNEARSHIFGALNPDFDLMAIVRAELETELPDNAHVLCSNRLRISLTRFRDMKNVIISEFHSKDDLIQAVICSCFIPVYAGLQYPKFRGEIYIDGGVTDNQPVTDKDTITISPFSGANDICPSDADSAGMLDMIFNGTSIRFTANNLYRVMVSLFPPSADVCSRICRQGFVDALKFLLNNGLVPCVRCLTVEANSLAVIPAACETETLQKKRQRNRISSSSPTSNRTPTMSECERCSGTTEASIDIKSTHLFPKIMLKPFEEVKEIEHTLVQYLRSFRIYSAVEWFTYPLTVNIQLLRLCKSLICWLSRHTSDWFTERLHGVVAFLVQELNRRQSIINFSWSGPEHLEMTKYDYPAAQDHLKPSESALWRISAEEDEWHNISDVKSLSKTQKLQSIATNSVAGESNEQAPIAEEHIEDVDSISRVVDYMHHHDAVLAYYYTDDNEKMRVCEIFDMNGTCKRHDCHSRSDHHLI